MRPCNLSNFKRTSSPGFTTFDGGSLESLPAHQGISKRKSTYIKSRLPTFGSLTTSRPQKYQGSNVAIGSQRGGGRRETTKTEMGTKQMITIIGEVNPPAFTQKSDDGVARKQMTPNEEEDEANGHHDHPMGRLFHHMTSH